MRLDPFVRDYPAFMNELMETLEADTTRFYLDTSLLMWLVRLGDAPRADFLSWCRSRPAGTVRVPVWAAHELHKHLIAKTVMTNVNAVTSVARKKLDELVRLATERADQAVCQAKGFTSRDAYINELRLLFERANRLISVVEDDSRLVTATDEVISLVNDFVLETDLSSIMMGISQTGEFRYSHLVPPGYQDKKDVNRYGDLVIWEELVGDVLSVSQDAKFHGVLISRDEKTDWVSSAPKIVNETPVIDKPNRDRGFDVTRAHPLLAHEFAFRAKGDRIYIIPPSLLASALDYASRRARQPSKVRHWLSAAYRPDHFEHLASSRLSVAGEAPPSSNRLGRAAPLPQVHTASEAVTFTPPRIGELAAISGMIEARDYEVLAPDSRPNMVTTWVTGVQNGTMPPAKFGRIFAELILAQSTDWITEVPSLFERLSAGVQRAKLNEVILSFSVPVFFDRYGQLRPTPELALGEVVLELERDTRFLPALSALTQYLNDANAELPYTPGSGRQPIRYALDAADGSGGIRQLRNIRLNNQPAIAEPVHPESYRLLTRLLSREPGQGCTGLELRMLIARQFLIPAELLNTDFDRRQFSWPPAAGLVNFDTGSEGGLSALADDEEGDHD